MKVGILTNSLLGGREIYQAVNDLSFCEVFLIWGPAKKTIAFRECVSLIKSFLLSKNSRALWKLFLQGRIIILGHALHNSSSIKKIEELDLDVGLHKSATIYQENTISCFKRGILNAHIGLLPKYRGRCVMEWSLLQGDPAGVSVFFIDKGIDTGRQMVLKKEISISGRGCVSQAKNYLFGLDVDLYKESLEKMHNENFLYLGNDGSGKRYYVMSDLFLSVVEKILIPA